MKAMSDPASDFVKFAAHKKFGTILADPPWRFQNSTGKVAPEHKRLSRYGTLSLDEIKSLLAAAYRLIAMANMDLPFTSLVKIAMAAR